MRALSVCLQSTHADVDRSDTRHVCVLRRMRAGCVSRALRAVVNSDNTALLDSPVAPIRTAETTTAAQHWLAAHAERLRGIKFVSVVGRSTSANLPSLHGLNAACMTRGVDKRTMVSLFQSTVVVSKCIDRAI